MKPGEFHRPPAALALALLACLSGCEATEATAPTQPEPVTSTGSVVQSTTSIPTTTSAATTTSVAEPVLVELDVYLDPVETGPSWSEILFLPYGSTPESVGNGLDQHEPLGPELPVARDPSGRWWVSDTHKQRIAIFAEDGRLDEEVVLEPRTVVWGIQVLDDGTAIGLSAPGRFAIIAEEVDYSSVGGLSVLSDHDGSTAYGVQGLRLFAVTLDSEGPAVERVDYFRTRAGTRYSVKVDQHDFETVVVALPDADPPVNLRLKMRATDEGTIAAIVEAVAGPDGSVHLLLIGTSEASPEVQRGVYLHIEPDGTVENTKSIPDPFGDLDPGTPNHLGIDPVTGTPYVAVIDDDGVRVWLLGE